jgi:aminoglycoside 3-N-acetyltransferase
MRSLPNSAFAHMLNLLRTMLDWLPTPAKSYLRKYYYLARSTYYSYCRPFTPADLLATVREVGLCSGDVVLVHSSFAKFLGFRGTAQDVIRTLQRAVGPHGTLMMPTLSFSGSALAYVRQAKFADLARSPSKVGLLSEIFRRSEGVVRSHHPTHSVAVWGAEAGYLVQGHHLAATPCGRGTPFFRLWEKGGKILLLGVDISPLTFFHCVEELIENVMPFSPFTVEVFAIRFPVDGNLVETAPMRLYDPDVSSRRNLGVLEQALRRNHAWHQRRLGSLQITLLNAADVLCTTKSLASKGIYCYRKPSM